MNRKKSFERSPPGRARLTLLLRRRRQDHVDALVDVEDQDVGVGKVVLVSNPGQHTNRQAELCLGVHKIIIDP